ncbi:MAG: hypothetical protein ACOYZ7_03410, partial [Chloroflexota bacterium]
THTPTATATPTHTPQPTATATPSATPTDIVPTFTLIAFAPDVTDDDQPIDPRDTFPAGTTKVYAVFDFSGMQDGAVYDVYWYRDGEEELQKSWEWEFGEQGTSWVNIFNDDGLTPGDYELETYVGEHLVLYGQFVILAPSAAKIDHVRFALAETDDDLPLGIGEVFPYGVTEVFAFFDYTGFEAVTEVESTWLVDGEVNASGTLEWWGKASGAERIRLFDEDPLVAGAYEWQLSVGGTRVAGGSFEIVEPLLFDDFSDPNSGWSESQDTDSSQGYRDGEYYINVIRDNLAVWSTAGYNLDDFTLQVRTLQLTGDATNEYGVIFRYTDSSNFYSFDVSGDGSFALFKLENQEWVALVSWRKSPYVYSAGEPNLLKVVCQGERIIVYANDHELASVTDSTFTQGDVGLFAGTFDQPPTEAVFDDLWAVWMP